MLTAGFDPDKLENRLRSREMEARRPLSCLFELTYRCNFHCSMCYVRMTDTQAAPFGRLRTVDEWLEIARQAYKAGVLYLTLTGGECTRYEGFSALYRELSRMGFRVSLMSNAGAYSGEMRELFTADPPYEVTVSLYGGSNETYGKVTGDPKGLDKVLENIRFLQSIHVPVSAVFTMIRPNIHDYPLVARICRQLGIPYNLATDITPHSWNASYSGAVQCRLSPAERACVACHPPDEVEEALRNAEALSEELPLFRQAVPDGETQDEILECVGSLSSAAIHWNGKMGSCISMTGEKNVDPFEIGFEAAWQELQKDRVNRMKLPAECAACGMKDDCHFKCSIRHYIGTGKYDKPDPYICQYTWLLKKYRTKLEHRESPMIQLCNN